MTDSPPARPTSASALAAVASFSDRLHDITMAAYAHRANSYTHTSLQAAIRIRVAAAGALRWLREGGDQPGLASWIHHVVAEIRTGARQIKADMEFFDAPSMDVYDAVAERLDWQALVLARLADEPTGQQPGVEVPTEGPAEDWPASEMPAETAAPEPLPVDANGQGSMF